MFNCLYSSCDCSVFCSSITRCSGVVYSEQTVKSSFLKFKTKSAFFVIITICELLYLIKLFAIAIADDEFEKLVREDYDNTKGGEKKEVVKDNVEKIVEEKVEQIVEGNA